MSTMDEILSITRGELQELKDEIRRQKDNVVHLKEVIGRLMPSGVGRGVVEYYCQARVLWPWLPDTEEAADMWRNRRTSENFVWLATVAVSTERVETSDLVASLLTPRDPCEGKITASELVDAILAPVVARIRERGRRPPLHGWVPGEPESETGT